MKKRIFLLPLLSVFLLAVIGLRIYDQYEKDVRIFARKERENFSYHTSWLDNSYQEGRPMEEIPFQRIGYLRGTGFASSNEEDYCCSLPFSVTYYRMEDGKKVPALTLEKGTDVCFLPATAPVFGYGLISYPTYEKGWRYAVPFYPAGEAPRWPNGKVLTQEECTFYYVRLSDLEQLSFLLRLPMLKYNDYRRMLKVNRMNPWDYAQYETRQIDAYLARCRAYLSLDLEISLWDWVDTFLLFLAALCALPAVRRLRAVKKPTA